MRGPEARRALALPLLLLALAACGDEEDAADGAVEAAASGAEGSGSSAVGGGARRKRPAREGRVGGGEKGRAERVDEPAGEPGEEPRAGAARVDRPSGGERRERTPRMPDLGLTAEDIARAAERAAAAIDEANAASVLEELEAELGGGSDR